MKKTNPTFDDLIRAGRDTDAMRFLAKEYYDNGKMGHTRKLLLERVADRCDALAVAQKAIEETWEWDMYKCAEREIDRLRKEIASLAIESVKREKTLAGLESEVMAAVGSCGKWEKKPNGHYRCSECGQVEWEPQTCKYCPYCGAKMEVEG